MVPGLRLRVSPSGAKSWAVYYRLRGNQHERLFTLGRYPELSLGRARDQARRVLARAGLGDDPQADLLQAREEARAKEQIAQGPRFRDICADFVEDQSPDWRPATRASWIRYIEREIKPAFGDRVPAEIHAREVRAFVERIRKGVRGEKPEHWIRRPAPVSAQRAYEVLRRICAWGVWKERFPLSPCEQARPFEPGKRSGKAGKAAQRVKAYSNEQIQRIFSSARGTAIENLVDLIARTGARSHEARAARWEDFDLQRKVWAVPPEMQKSGALTGQPHMIPLSIGALRVIKRMKKANDHAGDRGSPWLFPAATSSCEVCLRAGHMDKPNKASAAVKETAGIGDRGLLHRFRDTLKTRLSEHGVEARVSEHVLGHVVPGIAGVYDHAEMLPQRRQALDWWSDELDRILKSKRSPKVDASRRPDSRETTV